MLRPIYTHTRDIYVEIMKSRVFYHIPSYEDDVVLKMLSLQKRVGGFILELERKPLETATPTQEQMLKRMNMTDFR